MVLASFTQDMPCSEANLSLFTSQMPDSVMENVLLQKLDVLPQADNDRHRIYHSSQSQKIEQHVCKPWDGNGKQRDNFITAAPNGRDTGNKIH